MMLVNVAMRLVIDETTADLLGTRDHESHSMKGFRAMLNLRVRISHSGSQAHCN